MAARKKTGGGSRKGKPNKSTAAAREAIAAFVDGNADKLQGWLDQVAKTDPERAFGMFLSLVEYHVPKQARVEHTGKDGGPIVVALDDADKRA
jgi:hypothetical protein